MTIAQELEDQLFIIADPKMKWVRHEPEKVSECCLILAIPAENGRWRKLSKDAVRWLDAFVYYYSVKKRRMKIGGFGLEFYLLDNYGFRAADWNDLAAKNRQEAIWMLEEAVDQAKWEGV